MKFLGLQQDIDDTGSVLNTDQIPRSPQGVKQLG